MMIKENLQLIIPQIIKILEFPFNRIFLLAVSSQIVSMIIKLITVTIKNRRFSLKAMAQYGGMPSSHTAFIVSMVFGAGLDPAIGFKSPLFAFGFVLAALTLSDAIKFRGNVDKLNNIVSKIIESDDKFKDVVMPSKIAHTPLEVVVSIVFSFFYTLVFYMFFYSLLN